MNYNFIIRTLSVIYCNGFNYKRMRQLEPPTFAERDSLGPKSRSKTDFERFRIQKPSNCFIQHTIFSPALAALALSDKLINFSRLASRAVECKWSRCQ